MDNQKLTGLPLVLTEYLIDRFNIKTFIETGTGIGRTANIASSVLEHVYTIEADVNRWGDNKRKFNDKIVTCILGKSPDALQSLLCELKDERLIIFLDAHCSYRKAIDDDVCPLLDEIAIIKPGDIIIIDDEHSFTKPHKVQSVMNKWPDLMQVILALHEHQNNPYVFIEGKSIVSVPRSIKSDVQEFIAQQRI
jgi:predicted O-methyltransferase YrrM